MKSLPTDPKLDGHVIGNIAIIFRPNAEDNTKHNITPETSYE